MVRVLGFPKGTKIKNCFSLSYVFMCVTIILNTTIIYKGCENYE